MRIGVAYGACLLAAWLTSGCRSAEEPCQDPSEVRFCGHCRPTSDRRVSCNYFARDDEPLDLRPLLRFQRLESLSLAGRPVEDLRPLRRLRHLEELNLLNTGVADVGPLAGLDLVRLNLCNTLVTDLRPLRGMRRLTDLNIAGTTPVTDLGPLAGLTRLGQLDVTDGSCHPEQLQRLRASLPSLNIRVHERSAERFGEERR